MVLALLVGSKPFDPTPKPLKVLARNQPSDGGEAQAAVPAAKSPIDDRASAKAQALDQLAKDLKAGKKTAISDAKSRAKAKLAQLMERLKLLKKLYADNPKMMAKELAALAKEMKGAVKEYASAAKDSGEMISQDLKAPADASAPPEAQAAARETAEDQAKAEARGDMEFIKSVREISNVLKDQLLTAKTKGILTVKGKFEQSEEYKDAEDSLKDLDKMVEDTDQQIRSDMPAGSLLTLKA